MRVDQHDLVFQGPVKCSRLLLQQQQHPEEGYREIAGAVAVYRLRIWPPGGGGLALFRFAGGGEIVLPGDEAVFPLHQLSITWLSTLTCVLGGSSRSSATLETSSSLPWILRFSDVASARQFEKAWSLGTHTATAEILKYDNALSQPTDSQSPPMPQQQMERTSPLLLPATPSQSTPPRPSSQQQHTHDSPYPEQHRSPQHPFLLQPSSPAAEPDLDSLPANSHLARAGIDTVRAYFTYYSRISSQANMLQDSVRTEAYARAVGENSRTDFVGKRIMDVGAGSGILSFMAIRAGAAEVIAVEASSAADIIRVLMQTNPNVVKPHQKLRILQKTVETVELKEDLGNEKVDLIISEPIGTFLFNERMIESFLYARDHFLKLGGKLYPDICTLCLAPFSDGDLYLDSIRKSNFWQCHDFHGIDLAAIAPAACNETFSQPVIDHINPECIVTRDFVTRTFDLNTIARDSLANMQFDLHFTIESPCFVHGIAGWFDVGFRGTQAFAGFSTAPWHPSTHWYQIRFLFLRPLAVNEGARISGKLVMQGNIDQSYNIMIEAGVDGTNARTKSAVIDLKDPDYRYYTGSSTSAAYIQPTAAM